MLVSFVIIGFELHFLSKFPLLLILAVAVTYPVVTNESYIKLTKVIDQHWPPNPNATTIGGTVKPVEKRIPKYNRTHPFPVRIVGIFVADSELPYTLELAKPSIDIAIKKVRNLGG